MNVRYEEKPRVVYENVNQSCSESEVTPLLQSKEAKKLHVGDHVIYVSGRIFIIPQRWVFAIMGFFAVANAYTMRVCLSLAITEMVIPKENGVPIIECTEAGCFDGDREYYDWSQAQQGVILSAFFYGYIVTHLPGGMIAEKFGGKYSLGLGILSTALFTLITPIVIQTGGAEALIALRVLEGMGEGTTFPALNALLAQWAPLEERGRMGSLVFGGAQMGNIAGIFFSGLLMNNFSWPSVFYLFGVIGILWFILWVVLCYSDPNSHPYISDEEKKYLEEAIGGSRPDSMPIPWVAILTSVPLWALIAAQIGHDWGYFTVVTDLPKYMSDVLKFNVLKIGIWATLPYIVMWFTSMGFGWICDKLIEKRCMSTSNARKLFTTIASVGPGVCIILASYAGSDEAAVVALFTVAMGLMGAFYPGMKVNGLDLSTNYAGTLMAIVNGIGALSGIVTPYLVGLLTPDSTLEQWRTVFWIVLGVFVGTNIIFIVWASGEEQWWNNIPKYGYPPNWKRARPVQVNVRNNEPDVNGTTDVAMKKV